MSEKLQGEGDGRYGMVWDTGDQNGDLTSVHSRSSEWGDICYLAFGFGNKLTRLEIPHPKPFLGFSFFGDTSVVSLPRSSDEEEFRIYPPEEHLVSMEGYGDGRSVQGLRFITNKKNSQLMGRALGSYFLLKVPLGKKIIGFHGYASTGALYSIGAYCVPIHPKSLRTRRLQAPCVEGGGSSWDDGGDYDGVSKIYIGTGDHGIKYIKFDYVKSGYIEHGLVQGVEDKALTSTFEINYPEEYLTFVNGYYNSSNFVQWLQFNTNNRTFTSGLLRYKTGTEFSLQLQGNKIVGFYGFSHENLISLGGYFAPSSSPGDNDGREDR
ncbi:Jacalin-related lectin 18 [Cardamine amara subsp. amara]|uniref:Jacalin-related lectin 18 n=1 Tax=Cardamine amara subsp. amara TaxID=228776 RepID=A0ABD1BI42_CARAN